MRYLIYMLAIVVTLQCTAYTHSTNPTASGVMPQVGHCAVDKINGQWIPFGTVIRTSDGRVLTVTDRFGDGRNNALDIFMQSESNTSASLKMVMIVTRCSVMPFTKMRVSGAKIIVVKTICARNVLGIFC